MLCLRLEHSYSPSAFKPQFGHHFFSKAFSEIGENLEATPHHIKAPLPPFLSTFNVFYIRFIMISHLFQECCELLSLLSVESEGLCINPNGRGRERETDQRTMAYDKY